MDKAIILYKGQNAAELIRTADGSYILRYLDEWLADPGNPSISLTLPRQKQEYRSDYLFPFFASLLPEGTNKDAVLRFNKLDEEDSFGLLLASASGDPPGAVQVLPA